MTDPDKSALSRVTQLAQNEEYEEALRLGAELKLQYPQSAGVRKELAYVYELARREEEAIREVSEAIDLDDGQPDYYFTRGRLLLEVGRNSETIEDCTKAIEVGQQHGWDYYFSAACFVRALAKARTGDARGALEDCNALPDDTCLWALGGLQTKSQLTDELKRKLRTS